jgi:hypothetical protein
VVHGRGAGKHAPLRMIAIVPVVAAASKPVHRCSLIYSDSRCGRAGTAFVGKQNRGRAKPQTNRASNEVRRSHLDAAALLPCCPAALLPCQYTSRLCSLENRRQTHTQLHFVGLACKEIDPRPSSARHLS